MRTRVLTIILIVLALCVSGAAAPGLFWPAPPDAPRVQYIGEIDCRALNPKSGFLGKVKRLISGSSKAEDIGLPFDVLVHGRRLFATCQNIPALVEIDLDGNTFRLHTNDENPLQYPIALCEAGGSIYVTDSEAGAVFRLRDGHLEAFISEGLLRPTGIAALDERQRLYIVDTGDHSIKVFDYDGEHVATIGGAVDSSIGFNFPTFAIQAGEDAILVNDALNHNIKRLSASGTLLSSFGQEGDGPGTFARPKGVAIDSQDHVYVVDNLFDNIQVFDPDGRLLLVIGSGGQGAGQFWSPGGIDIANDTIYVADTFNNRIQIFHYLGGRE